MQAIFNTRFFTPLIVSLTIFAFTPYSSATSRATYTRTAVSSGETWIADSRDSRRIKRPFAAEMSAEQSGLEACKIYFSNLFPEYWFFHQYPNTKKPIGFCDPRIQGNNGIDFIGVPQAGHSEKPFLIIEAKHNKDGRLKLSSTKTKGAQMSKQWCRASLEALWSTLFKQFDAELNEKIIHYDRIGCLEDTLKIVTLLLHRDATYIRLATVYNPTTGIIDLYTPISRKRASA